MIDLITTLRRRPSQHLTIIATRVQFLQQRIVSAGVHCVHVAPQGAQLLPGPDLQHLHNAA